MKFSSDFFDLFSKEIEYPIKFRNIYMKYIGFSITIVMFAIFSFLFFMYNILSSLQTPTEKSESFTNLYSYYDKNYDYNDPNDKKYISKYSNPYFFVTGDIQTFIQKREKIKYNFFEENNNYGNIGIFGLGILISDFQNKNQVLLNNSNIELSFKYYNITNELGTNSTSEVINIANYYPCSELIQDLESLYEIKKERSLLNKNEILQMFTCFNISFCFTKDLQYNESINTVPNIEIKISLNIDNVLLTILRIKKRQTLYKRYQFEPVISSYMINKGLTYELNSSYQNTYYEYTFLNLMKEDNFDSNYDNMNDTLNIKNNIDSFDFKSHFLINYFLMDTTKSVRFFNQKMIITYGIFGNLLFLFCFCGKLIYNLISVRFSLLPITSKVLLPITSKVSIIIEKKDEIHVDLLYKDMASKAIELNKIKEIQKEASKLIELTEIKQKNEELPKSKIKKLRNLNLLNTQIQKSEQEFDKDAINKKNDNIRIQEDLIYEQITRLL